ncbi:hypothetical protein CBL_02887 [Carabus blaptoides fortunei]
MARWEGPNVYAWNNRIVTALYTDKHNPLITIRTEIAISKFCKVRDGENNRKWIRRSSFYLTYHQTYYTLANAPLRQSRARECESLTNQRRVEVKIEGGPYVPTKVGGQVRLRISVVVVIRMVVVVGEVSSPDRQLATSVRQFSIYLYR